MTSTESLSSNPAHAGEQFLAVIGELAGARRALEVHTLPDVHAETAAGLRLLEVTDPEAIERLTIDEQAKLGRRAAHTSLARTRAEENIFAAKSDIQEIEKIYVRWQAS